ncbi:MAG: prepilin-type N-terminal cleavage/methylation domain-containing protein [Candidatus Omnitrophica bacterium]|nr:prepilin-type N-terminal cleavage/methylation domain-containing protein [Candidatus Omnitrophota bacterium]
MNDQAKNSQSGFTLVEILLAITIFVLIIGSIYASLFAGVNALSAGQESMEIYQTARAGMNRILKDLRKALSPASFPYEEEEEMLDQLDADFYGGYMEEDDEDLQLVFKGSSTQFECAIRQDTSDEDGPSMDVRQIRYRMGEDEENTVVKEIFRSILIARLEDTLRRRHEKQHGPESYFAPNASSGYFEDPIVQTVCDGVEKIEFAYYNGFEWQTSWDSEQIVINDFSQDLEDDLLQDEDEEKVGLPQLVRVTMTLKNGIVMEAATDVPGSDLNVLGQIAQESDFGSSFRNSLNRLDRLRMRASDRGYSRSSGRRNRFY